MISFLMTEGASGGFAPNVESISSRRKRSTSVFTSTAGGLNKGLLQMASKAGIGPGVMAIVILHLLYLIGPSIMFYLLHRISTSVIETESEEVKEEDKSEGILPSLRSLMFRDIPAAILGCIPWRKMWRVLRKT